MCQEINIIPYVVFMIKMPRKAVVTSVVLVFRSLGFETGSLDTTNETFRGLIFFNLLSTISGSTEGINNDTGNNGNHDNTADNEESQIVNHSEVEVREIGKFGIMPKLSNRYQRVTNTTTLTYGPGQMVEETLPRRVAVSTVVITRYTHVAGVGGLAEIFRESQVAPHYECVCQHDPKQRGQAQCGTVFAE